MASVPAEDCHPFFLLNEPTDPVKCLQDLRYLLETSRTKYEVSTLQLNSPLDVRRTGFDVPVDTTHAQNRLIRMIKKFHGDEQVVEDCGVVLGYLCGECTRPSVTVGVYFDGFEDQILMTLPDFSQGDVGFRLWGACFLLSRHLFNENLKGRIVVELGAASGLCGIVAARMGCQQVYLTDFNEACVAAAKATIKINHLENVVQPAYLDWSMPLGDELPWVGALLIGAAVVYEERHADLMCDFLSKAFVKGAEKALLAIHTEHSGHDGFRKLVVDRFSVLVVDSRTVREVTNESLVILLDIRPRS